MVDISSAPQTLQKSSAQTVANSEAKLRSDGGTILLHWLTVLSMVASLLTGLRISADGQYTYFAHAISGLLPQGEIWTWHMLASIVLLFSMVAYFVYAKRAALLERNAPARLRTLTPPTTSRLRWRAINVALHWFAYGAIIALTVTGTILYLGHGGLFVTVHKALAWTMLFYIVIHTLAHFMYGGLNQILRLFRPQALVMTRDTGTWPVTLAVASGLTFALAFYALDETTKPELTVLVVNSEPVLDGRLDDAVWANAATATMPTQQGANLGGSGTSDVEVKAVRTDEKIHFAFRWQDPTRSLMRSPVVKREDGWHVMSTRAAQADVNDYYEDKFAVLFSHSDKFGGGASTFLGDDPLPAYPKSPHGRGLHYTADGRVMDLWQWKSSRGGLLGHVDDMHFGPPKKPNAKQKAGKKRYAAGYDADPGKSIYEYNYIADGPKGYESPVRLKRLPVDLAQTRFSLGEIPANDDQSNSEGSLWWMTRENSLPYSAALDAAIPVGTILPTTLNIHTYQGDRADLAGGARWENGYWTLEVSRDLDTGSGFDTAFHPGTSIYIWVSVFDHNQTRHTRHQRPIRLDIQ